MFDVKRVAHSREEPSSNTLRVSNVLRMMIFLVPPCRYWNSTFKSATSVSPSELCCILVPRGSRIYAHQDYRLPRQTSAVSVGSSGDWVAEFYPTVRHGWSFARTYLPATNISVSSDDISSTYKKKNWIKNWSEHGKYIAKLSSFKGPSEDRVTSLQHNLFGDVMKHWVKCTAARTSKAVPSPPESNL